MTSTGSHKTATKIRGGRQGGLGLAQGVALYIASVLGTGVLALPGLSAAAAGPASLLAVGAVLLLSIPLAGTFAALAARFPDPGGVASFVRTALGDTAARMTGYWFFFGVAAGFPVVATLGAEYVAAVVGIDRSMLPILAIAIGLPPIVLNYFGVRTAGWVQMVLTALLLAVVILVVSAAGPHTTPGYFEPFMPEGWAGVGVAISLFVWAFAGWEVGTHISGEFRRPRRDIPLATAIALAVTGIAYLALQWVTIGVLGEDAGVSAVSLLALAQIGIPGGGPVIIAVIAGIVTVGVANAYLAAFGKLGASLAERGDLPAWFAPGAEAGGIPRRALTLTVGVLAVWFTALIFNGMTLTPFILVHTGSMVLIYLLGMIAAVRLLPRGSVGWCLAILATVLTAGLVVLAGQTLLPAVGLAVIAVVVTLIRRWRARR